MTISSEERQAGHLQLQPQSQLAQQQALQHQQPQVTGSTDWFDKRQARSSFCYGQLESEGIASDEDDYIDFSRSNVNTLVEGLDGRDTLNAGAGNDLLCGDAGNDILRGGDGDDIVMGGDGFDILRGGGGNDILYGENGPDDLSGGDGDDILDGEHGDDALRGGRGSDTFVFRRGDGGDRIWWDREYEDPGHAADDDVVFFADVNANELRSVSLSSYGRQGRYLELIYGENDRLTIHLQRENTPLLLVDHFRFADGETFSAGTLLDRYAGASGLLDASGNPASDQRWGTELSSYGSRHFNQRWSPDAPIFSSTVLSYGSGDAVI